MEERVVAAGCRRLDIGVVVHARLGGAKRDREEVTGALDGVVHTGGVERLGQSLLQLGAAGVKVRVDGGISQGQGRNTRRDGQRVTGEGTRLVDGADRRQVLHDLTLTGQRRDGHTATNDLAERENIGNPAAILGSRVTPVTSRRHTETGQHLIKNDERTVRVSNLVQATVETGLGGHHTHVAGRRLSNNRGNLTLMVRERLTHSVQVVIGQNDGLRGGCGSHASRTRQRQGCHARTRLGKQRIHVTVVAARKLNNLVATGHTTRQTDSSHRRLSTGGHHTHLINRTGNRRVNTVDHQLSQLSLRRARRTKRQAALSRLLNRLNHLRMRVAQNRRAPRADQVNVLVAVRIVQVRALSLRRKRRSAAHRIESTHRGIHTTGNHHARTLKQLLAGFVVQRVGRGRSHRIGAFQQRRRTKELQGTTHGRRQSPHATSVPYPNHHRRYR